MTPTQATIILKSQFAVVRIDMHFERADGSLRSANSKFIDTDKLTDGTILEAVHAQLIQVAEREESR